MRIVTLGLALIASGASAAGDPAPKPMPLTMEDYERMDLIGAGCAWSSKDDPETTLIVATDERAGMRIGGRDVVMAPDPASPLIPEGFYDVRTVYSGAGVKIELRPVEKAWRTTGYESRELAADLLVTTTDGTQTGYGPGTLSCGA